MLTYTQNEVLNNAPLKKNQSGKADMFFLLAGFHSQVFVLQYVLLFSFKYTGPFTSVSTEEKTRMDNPKQLTWECTALFGSSPL